jgi:hypothetical protein
MTEEAANTVALTAPITEEHVRTTVTTVPSAEETPGVTANAGSRADLSRSVSDQDSPTRQQR